MSNKINYAQVIALIKALWPATEDFTTEVGNLQTSLTQVQALETALANAQTAFTNANTSLAATDADEQAAVNPAPTPDPAPGA